MSIIQPDLASILYVDGNAYTNGNSIAIQLFSLPEMPDDYDGDGVDNNNDDFPYDNSETTDTDNDGIGNNADLDDDGDGCSDEFELDFGTDPLIADCSVNIDEINESTTIEIYPNPVSNEISIYSSSTIVRIVIKDVSGKIVREYQEIRDSKITLDVLQLEVGTYLLQIQDTSGTVIKKIVKE